MLHFTGFIPPRCPHPECRNHIARPEVPTQGGRNRNGTWYMKKGVRFNMGGKPVQIYRCKSCKGYFSSRTFSIDYYSKRVYDYNRLRSMLAAGLSLRAISRNLECSVASVKNKLLRLNRLERRDHPVLVPDYKEENRRAS
jgi:hypothetical protein